MQWESYAIAYICAIEQQIQVQLWNTKLIRTMWLSFHSGSYLNTQKDLLLISKAEGRIITLRMTCYHVCLLYTSDAADEL